MKYRRGLTIINHGSKPLGFDILDSKRSWAFINHGLSTLQTLQAAMNHGCEIIEMTLLICTELRLHPDYPPHCLGIQPPVWATFPWRHETKSDRSRRHGSVVLSVPNRMGLEINANQRSIPITANPVFCTILHLIIIKSHHYIRKHTNGFYSPLHKSQENTLWIPLVILHSHWKWPLKSWVFPLIAWWFSSSLC